MSREAATTALRNGAKDRWVIDSKGNQEVAGETGLTAYTEQGFSQLVRMAIQLGNSGKVTATPDFNKLKEPTNVGRLDSRHS
ncbi:hypothetical protein [Uliginosibacterium sp. H1]|uniref:hypothetical protein n=1 Tax=Uliginosibacterium sp. H1 TaxID=3114757 RepID=UPI002E18B2F5|nr:hypothetical protein [Uliginosibacterium sp. H1]